MKIKTRYIIYLFFVYSLSMCTKPAIEEDKIDLKKPIEVVINEVFELEYNQHAIITDTTRIVNDSFPKYSAYFDWINDKRCSPCVSCFGGFVYTNVHFMNTETKQCVSDTLYYPSCTENYLVAQQGSYVYKPITIDSVNMWMKRILPMRPQENKSYIGLNEFKISLIMKKRE